MKLSFKLSLPLVIAAIAAGLLASACAQTQSATSGATGASAGSGMSFFVTSANPGKGADLGGLSGADQYCQKLAASAGAGGRNWRAYLSNSAVGGAPAVNARDRIGRGPWQNAKGEVIASNVEELHANNKISKQTALTEKGEVVSGRGDTVNTHDILTGTQADGRAFAGDKDMTCGNWTKSGEGVAMVGHHDRQGLRDDAESKSWNASHPTKACDMDSLKATGGSGLLYCFAAN